jgi:hypothetical protein
MMLLSAADPAAQDRQVMTGKTLFDDTNKRV